MQTYGRVGLDGQSVAVATAMTLGDKQLISKEVKDDYSISGASHVLALSGLHLGIIYAFFLFGFNLCKGIPYLNLFVRYHLSELFRTIANMALCTIGRLFRPLWCVRLR